MSKKRFPISSFRHRLHLCSQKDVVTDGTLRLARDLNRTIRASIEVKKPNAFNREGGNISPSDTRTHIIRVRHMDDVEISTYAWLYEERIRSADRWFKILSVTETENSGMRYYTFDCRLTERTDDLPPETDTALDPVFDMPQGVAL